MSILVATETHNHTDFNQVKYLPKWYSKIKDDNN